MCEFIGAFVGAIAGVIAIYICAYKKIVEDIESRYKKDIHIEFHEK